MEIIFYILVGLGIFLIAGKFLVASFAALTGLVTILIPIAVICAIIFLISFLF